MASTPIPNYRHGLVISFPEAPAPAIQPGPSGIVGIVGSAEDLAVPGRRNVPILIRSWATAAATFGPSALLNALRIIYDQGPAQCVVVNVFDPASDFGAWSEYEDIALTGDTYVDDALVGKGATVAVQTDLGVDIAEAGNWSWDPATATLTRDGAGAIAADAALKLRYALPDPAATPAASAIGSDAGNFTGVHALRRSAELAHAAPDVLIAPGFSGHVSGVTPDVGEEMSKVADLLDAVAGVDDDSDSDSQAVDFVKYFNDPRVFVCGPEIGIADPADRTKEVPCAQSALWAGIIAARDAANVNSVGWSESASNRIVRGVRSTKRPIDHSWTKSGSRADYLNSWRINTVFRDGSWYSWGGLSSSDDEDLVFLSVVRIRDKIAQALALRWRRAVDAKLSGEAFLDEVVTEMQVQLDDWVGLGALRWARAAVSARNADPGKPKAQSWFRISIEPPEPNHRMDLEFVLTTEAEENAA